MAILLSQLCLGTFHTKQNMLLCCVNISKLVFNTGNKFGPSANTLLNQCHDMTSSSSNPSGKVHVRPKLVTSCSCHDNMALNRITLKFGELLKHRCFQTQQLVNKFQYFKKAAAVVFVGSD